MPAVWFELADELFWRAAMTFAGEEDGDGVAPVTIPP
jgi:hypothetical protein